MSGDYNQIGKYGTLMFLKTKQDTPVTAFGIDRDELTFGRDKSCDVRLLYQDILPLHCKIKFSEDHKAFLVVLGSSGVSLDGDLITPDPDSDSTNAAVPMSNNSEIEIHGKKFRFAYPPKEMRPVLYNSPAPKTRRKLRLSLIESAEVFTPRPSPNPKENLRVLKSPLKRSPTKSTLSRVITADDEDDDDEDEVVLVEGNAPKVVQEDKDLVILEEIERAPPKVASPTKPRVQISALQRSPTKQEMKTPPRRAGRPSLHRHVLIKSAQRAVVQRDVEQEDEEEIEEVLGTVAANVGSDSDSDDGEERGGEGDAMNVDEDEAAGDTPSRQTWRQSLGSIWPFNKLSPERDPSVKKEVVDPKLPAADQPMANESSDDDDEADLDELCPLPSQTPRRAPPLSTTFMTPQPRASAEPKAALSSRLSLGPETQPRRIFAQPRQSWKIQDIVVPEPKASAPPSPVKDEKPRPRSSVSLEERKAIAERRRSALIAPDTFFGPTGVPGMSPVRRGSVSPTKMHTMRSEDDEETEDKDKTDSHAMMARMRATMANVERRQSLQPSTPNLGHRSARNMDVDEVDDYFAAPASKPSTAFNVRPPIPSSGPRLTAELFEKDKDGDDEMIVEESTKLLSHAAEPSTSKKPPTRTARGVFQDTPSLADDEASPGDPIMRHEQSDGEKENEEPFVPAPRVMKARAPRKVDQAHLAPETNSDTHEGQRRSTRARSKTPQPTEMVAGETAKTTATRRARPKTIPEDENDEESAKPTKRARTTKSSAPAESESEPVKRSVRSNKPPSTADEESTAGRKATAKVTRTKKPPSRVESLIEEDEEAAEAASQPKMSRPVRKTRAKVKEEDPGLMDIPVVQTRSGKQKPESSTAKKAAPEPEKENQDETRVRVSRSRKVTSKAKEEPQTEPEKPTRARVTRARAART